LLLINNFNVVDPGQLALLFDSAVATSRSPANAGRKSMLAAEATAASPWLLQA
jgi:hypothetical protein